MKRIKALAKSECGTFQPKMSEEDILDQIRQLLEANGATVFRSIERVPKCYRCGLWLGSSDRGISDLFGWIVAGKVTRYPVPFWIETKSAKGKLRPAQRDFLTKAQSVGLLAFMARSWSDVLEKFAERGIVLKV